MNIGKLNTTSYQSLGFKPDVMVAIRGAGARLYRVCSVPERFQSNPMTEVLLREISYKVKDGVYYIKLRDFEHLVEIVDEFALHDIDLTFSDDNPTFRDRWGWPLAEYCN